MLPSKNLHLSYLERLSTPELRNLAANFGVDIPQDLDRLFIIEELLDNAPCLTFFQAGKIPVKQVEVDLENDYENIPLVPDPSELPKRYGITQIDAIVRDPLWVFVFWEIRDVDRKLYEKPAGFNGYFLRVSLDQCKMGNAVSALFTIPVSAADSEWYINFPPDGHCRKICNMMEDAPFHVALCASRAGGDVELAATRPFRLPRMLEISERSFPVHDKNTLLRMSGMDDLLVLRNSDRISFSPKSYVFCDVDDR
ncbi:MAG: DUF4912 domain-containing protein [Spirochaetaceae bacterium]|jgi:hypothetical protein|nr:DUF4912 domain-containing protein [Spirochaetaceae bacterium]